MVHALEQLSAPRQQQQHHNVIVMQHMRIVQVALCISLDETRQVTSPHSCPAEGSTMRSKHKATPPHTATHTPEDWTVGKGWTIPSHTEDVSGSPTSLQHNQTRVLTQTVVPCRLSH
jgi:hypothetical protein